VDVNDVDVNDVDVNVEYYDDKDVKNTYRFTKYKYQSQFIIIIKEKIK